MAAKIAGCKTIIALDRVESRLKLAQELGATHVINTANARDIQSEVSDAVTKALLNKAGLTTFIDTTAYVPLIQALIPTLRPGGDAFLIGVPQKPQIFLAIDPLPQLISQINIRFAMMGDAYPQEYIPKMIEWYRNGQFPINKLVGYFKVEDIDGAVKAMLDGSVVKPILVW
jgi:Zn-dependent alcohol dehydrogenase